MMPNHPAKEQQEQRYATVLYLRRQGLTFREIGERLGIGASRANAIHREATRWSERRVKKAEAK